MTWRHITMLATAHNGVVVQHNGGCCWQQFTTYRGRWQWCSWVVPDVKLSRWYSSSPTVVSRVLRGDPFWSCDYVEDKIQGEHRGTVGIDRLYPNLEHNPIEYLRGWQCWYIHYNSCCIKIAYVAVLLLPSWQGCRKLGAYKAVLLSLNTLFTYLTTHTQSPICSRAMQSMI